MTRRPPEAKRDELESAFTPILRRVLNALPNALCAVFVDTEGECIDYASSIDPFEAKVSGAHALVLLNRLRASHHTLGLQEPFGLAIAGTERELWARRITDDYLLVVVALPGAEASQMWTLLASAARDFRAEVSAAAASWEPTTKLEVVVRAAIGWPFAPAAFSQHGVRVAVTDVLGRWTEPGNGDAELSCFRVRTGDGQELTLIHDPSANGWRAKP
jgi:predicted regulator of Ras-like GTPase activity (Roadblock/LC7/MglB family)